MSPRRARADPSPVHVGFEVDKKAYGAGLAPTTRVFPANTFRLMLQTHSAITDVVSTYELTVSFKIELGSAAVITALQNTVFAIDINYFNNQNLGT
jgi:hypothetical protein